MQSLVAIGLTNALAAALLALVVALPARFARRPAVAHALWLLVLARLITPALIPLPVLPRFAPAPALVLPTSHPLDDAAERIQPPLSGNLVPEGTSRTPEFESAQPVEPAPVVQSAAPQDRPIDWMTLIGAVWAVLLLAWLAIAAVRLTRLRRSLANAPFAPPALQNQVARLGGELGLKRTPVIKLIDGGSGPFVWALACRATLVLPLDLWNTLDHEERDALLLHELAHLRRGDQWVRAIELLASAFYWWFPVLWWVRRGLHEAEERSCDAWVVAARPQAARSYASALVSTLEFLSRTASRSSTLAPFGASGMASFRHISRRVTMIMKGNVPSRLSPVSALAVAALALLCLPWRPVWANPQFGPSPAAPGATLQIPPAPAQVDPAQPASDEFEILKTRLAAKRAQTKKAAARMEIAKSTLARFERRNTSHPGSLSVEDLEKARADVAVAEADLEIAEAEAAEATLRVEQAARRSGQPAVPSAPRGAPRQDPRPTATPAPQPRTAQAAQAIEINNLKQLGIAFHNYADAHGNRFPPPFSTDKNGQPLLSWRVAILPYIEQDALYREFHLDEPWDSPHNATLLGKMPKLYQVAGIEPGSTSVRGVVGKDCILSPEMPEGCAFADILDGTSNTALVILSDVGDSVAWTKPETGEEASRIPPAFLTLMADGAVQMLSPPDPHTLKALFSRAGGEVIEFDKLRFQPPQPPSSREVLARTFDGRAGAAAPLQAAVTAALIANLEAQLARLKEENQMLREELAKRDSALRPR